MHPQSGLRSAYLSIRLSRSQTGRRARIGSGPHDEDLQQFVTMREKKKKGAKEEVLRRKRDRAPSRKARLRRGANKKIMARVWSPVDLPR